MQIHKYVNKQLSKWAVMLSVLFLLLTNSLFPGLIRGDELDDLENDLQNTRSQIHEYENQLNSTRAAIEAAKRQAASYQGTLQSFSGQLNYAKAQLDQTRLELEQKQLELENNEAKVREATLSVQYHESVLKGVVRDFYKKTFADDVSIVLTNETAGDVARAVMYRDRVSDNFHKKLLEIVSALEGLLGEQDQLTQEKEVFQKQQEELVAQQAYLEKQIDALNTNLAATQGRQAQLSQNQRVLEKQIGELTQKEQQLLAAKTAITNSVSTVGEIEAGLQQIPSAPSDGHYSVWTYGTPHQVGMSQYGAYGRSIAGQGYTQILNAYFSNITIDKFWDDANTIPVVGMGDISMKEYLYRIGEMPESWGNYGGYEALKAQVVVARTYALHYIFYSWNGSEIVDKDPIPICTTDVCQVLGNPKTGKWKQAVDETAGEVLLYNGKPITAWYSASAGGFVLSSQEQWGGYRPWALSSNDFDAQGNAYDGGKYINVPSGSPYYPWISNGSDYNNYWLSTAVMEDLLNATLLPEKYKTKLYNPDYSYTGTNSITGQPLNCTPSGGTGDGLSTVAVRNLLSDEGINPVTQLSSIQNIGHNSKQTQELVISDKFGTRQIDAQLFRDAFRRRAPGCYNIATKRFEVRKG